MKKRIIRPHLVFLLELSLSFQIIVSKVERLSVINFTSQFLVCILKTKIRWFIDTYNYAYILFESNLRFLLQEKYVTIKKCYALFSQFSIGCSNFEMLQVIPVKLLQYKQHSLLISASQPRYQAQCSWFWTQFMVINFDYTCVW